MSDHESEQPQALELATILQVLRDGRMELQGLLPWSSNYTFLVEVHADDQSELVLGAVYKPQRGENPLWDFPQGTLYKREAAAFLISHALGWHLVPPTVTREGPHGVGSVQLLIHADYEQHFFTLKEGHEREFQRMALFDIVINNADRKGGHVLVDDDQRIWAIDHGICFHDEYKLRTVIWDWVGQEIAEADLADLKQLDQDLEPETSLTIALNNLLYPREIKAMRQRLNRLISSGKFPASYGQRSIPWPPV